MNPTEWTALSTVAGALVGCGAVWGAAQATLRTLKASHAALRDDLSRHVIDRDIHIDPKRDRIAADQLKDFLSKEFAIINDQLEKIDKRCEERGRSCPDHFTALEKKLAAFTGKANGS